uniref:Late expression factor 2 n=1 Tax=Spilarctia obliqua nucleopolyhedrovirus TaxID=1638618 RepID=A0A7G9U869_9ABAC|nr:late expression factor 2 [Spilarctia obliqua nucleopolyhedrovirus]
MRLLALLSAAPKPTNSTTPAARRFPQRSKRNICLKACADGSVSLVKALTTRLHLPLCMSNIMASLSEAPRGNMYRKRFEFNCYLANVLTCTKCKTACLVGALLHFYKMDPKCVGEVMHLLVKAEDMYKPSNCAKMKTNTKLCPVAGLCKGKTPLQQLVSLQRSHNMAVSSSSCASEHKILQMFYRWSSKFGANLESDADLECLYDLERFVGAHLNGRIDAKKQKKKLAERAEKAAVKRVELAADRLAQETAADVVVSDDGRWPLLTRQQRDDIAREKEIVDRIYMLQLKQERMLKPKKG